MLKVTNFFSLGMALSDPSATMTPIVPQIYNILIGDFSIRFNSITKKIIL